MNREPVTLIFDIGKTTKKALIFDHAFHVLEEQTETFKEISDDDGFPADDLPRVSDWVTGIYRRYLDHPKYDVVRCNFSSYGASLVHLDATGNSIEPFYNYLKPFPQSVNSLFHKLYDRENEISAVTASPFLGLLNSGLQLFYLKHEKPSLFNRIHTSLHLPQYFIYLLTGKTFTDITSVGCHTMLWDFRRKDYHVWVEREDLKKLFPALHPADHVFDHPVGARKIRTGIGVHDSSAALMPYLVTQKEPFLLLSTGTWNICFNPFNHEPLTPEELASDCLCFLTYEQHPVKASRIFLGHEHDVQTKALGSFFHVSEDRYGSVAFDESLYESLINDPEGRPFYPIGMEGTGPIPQKQFQKTDFSAFTSYEEAYHQLLIYLIRWQLISIDLIDPSKNVKNIIVVGGFTKNPLFLEILKRRDHVRKILISDHPRASALGASWLVANKSDLSAATALLKITAV